MITDTFTALGNQTRLHIVEQLLRDGETGAGNLARDQNLSAPALSRHLKILREAGILSQRIDGQRRLYNVQPEAIRAVADWSLTYREFWGAGLDRLSAAMDNEAKKQ